MFADSAVSLVDKFVQYVIDPIMLVLFALAFFLFVYGVVEFLWSLSKGGDKLKEGRDHMIWGVVGMFIMVSVAGIINFLTGTFGINTDPNSIDVNNVNIKGGFFR